MTNSASTTQGGRQYTTTRVQVHHWNGYGASPPLECVHTHEMELVDQRAVNGQVYLTTATIGGKLEDMLCITAEVNTNPLNGIDAVPCVHVHFDDSGLAFSLFKVGDRILLVQENGVRLDGFTRRAGSGFEQLFWVDDDRQAGGA